MQDTHALLGLCSCCSRLECLEITAYLFKDQFECHHSRSLAESTTLSISPITLCGCLHYAPHCILPWTAPAYISPRS